MARNLADRFQRWFEHECHAHVKVIQSLESVPAERRSAPEYQRALSILAHIAAARKLWLVRLGVVPGEQGALFPGNASLQQTCESLQLAQRAWAEYLARLTDEDLGRVFEYQSLDAGRFCNRVEDILAQLFSHSSYHRGQIAMLVRAAGGEPAVTDLIYWCRESVPPA